MYIMRSMLCKKRDNIVHVHVPQLNCYWYQGYYDAQAHVHTCAYCYYRARPSLSLCILLPRTLILCACGAREGLADVISIHD